ncbi:uroporphyrinogen-III C-methyltransferase [Aquibacillus albus]|uniref:uroporphyrinogen-III C-methyltransferase n=1 Tax=Aquibacillus albus TaxID=1168171 RepID=A0ABS2N5D9_9BACI|nr:uroporphyrinogen-III C-methyltransferase [Aquibacillus albus]MBM7573331.1 uroporphyrinogen III methyltransferase/synthase [Aquibacillus albus]
MNNGKVYLVGAGPGDSQLITVKGLEAIKKSEVILYDRLANPKLLDSASPNCQLIYCGKLPNRHLLRQEAINELLIEKALDGKIVVRLKGGDPGVFGRVGEEADALAEHNIDYEIVPGVTSGIAAPLYAGIPVTHREFGESFAVVTAHDKSTNGKPKLNWKGLAQGVDTIAFYMGVGNLPFICESLIENGRSPETPVALIQWGTFARQKTLQGTLATIEQQAREVQFSNPAIILVGEVISLREKLKWFEKKPLHGRHILLARTSIGESKLAKKLTEQGADVIEFPKWKKMDTPIDRTILKQIKSYEKIVFTSPESVNEFFAILRSEKIDNRNVRASLFGCSIKSINAIENRGFLADKAEDMPEEGKLLIVGDDSLVQKKEQLTHQFGMGDMFITSKKVVDKKCIPIFERMLEEVRVDTVVFPSSASVEKFLQTDVFNSQALNSLSMVCMGEKTWKTAEANQLKPKLKPVKPTYEALLESLKGW